MVIISEVMIVKENEEDDLEVAIEAEKRSVKGTESGIEIEEGAEREVEAGMQTAGGDDETRKPKGQALLIGGCLEVQIYIKIIQSCKEIWNST